MQYDVTFDFQFSPQICPILWQKSFEIPIPHKDELVICDRFRTFFRSGIHQKLKFKAQQKAGFGMP